MGVMKNKRWSLQAVEGGALTGVQEMIEIGHDRFTEAIPLNYHKHERAFEFVYVHRGKATWEVGSTRYTSHAGQCFVTRPDELHRAWFRHIEPSEIWWFVLRDPADVPGWLGLTEAERSSMGELLHSLTRVISCGPMVKDDLQAVRAAIESNGPLTALRIRNSILGFILRLLHPTSATAIPSDLEPAIARLTDNIRRSPGSQWSNREMAAELGVSESHFYRVFHRMHGQSPASYVERVRVELACQMLEEGNDTILSIAMDLGYKTSQHFTTVFRKNTGITPSLWRSSARSGTAETVQESGNEERISPTD